jgi:hypothetical protein
MGYSSYFHLQFNILPTILRCLNYDSYISEEMQDIIKIYVLCVVI